MKKNQLLRIVLQIMVVVLFLVVSVITIFYALGYQYDRKTYRVIATGIVSIPQYISGAEVFLDEERVAEELPTNIGSVLPGKYVLEIRRANYAKWNREIEVVAGQVTVVGDIFMIPANLKNYEFKVSDISAKKAVNLEVVDENRGFYLLEFADGQRILGKFDAERKVFSGVADFVSGLPKISPSGEYMLLKKGLEIWIYDIDQDQLKFLTRFATEVRTPIWHPDSKNVFFVEGKKLKICDLDFVNCNVLAEVDSDSSLIKVGNDLIYRAGGQLKGISLSFE